MAAHSRTAAGLLIALAALLSVPLPQATPAAAQTGAPLLSSTPAVIDATVELGATLQLPLTLRNDSPDPISPRLFEAFIPGSLPTGDAPASARIKGPAQASLLGIPAPGPALDPQIAQAQALDPAGEAELIVVLADQADLSAAYAIADWAERGRFVYRTLTAHAERSQRALRATLAAREVAYTPLWIVNALALRGDAADVAVIAGTTGVAELWAARVATLEAPPAIAPAQSAPAACAAESANLCWNIARIGAGRAWGDFGVQGEGITVASIDSGVRFDHPALLAQYRGSGPTGVRHDYSWFDAYAGQPEPSDTGNHGTHTMGTMVARGLSASEPAVGVAPGARWIAARACSARDCSEIDLIRAAQWLLAPSDLAGENPRPDLRPHVINNSWTGGQNAGWYSGYVAAWRAAGIYPVFAAGNAGNLLGCGTIQSPGDYAQVTAVGATDITDRLTSFSSVGPSVDGRTKPDLTAPGQSVFSTVADQRGYGTNSGTSMATPHVAGAVALLWSANPSLIGDYEATYAALAGAAIPSTGDSRYMGPSHAACRPDSTPNSIYGHGRLDVYGAVARATVDVPWLGLPAELQGTIAPASTAELSLTLDARLVPGPGVYQARVLVHGSDLSRPPTMVEVTMRVPTDPRHAVVSGQLRRASDGAPLRGTVTVVAGGSVQADADGRYSLTLPPATAPYTLSATARDHVAERATVELGDGERLILDFELEADQPRLLADTAPQAVALAFGEQTTVLLPVSNVGTRPLSYTLSVRPDRYGVWRSDEADGPDSAWIEPPADAVVVPLTDDGSTGPLPIGFTFPFYQRGYDEFAISANGVIALAPPPAGELSFARTCLPVTETPWAAIAPLRVDLDPSRPGARVSYASLPDGLLVSWEEVPLYSDPERRLSFQALLTPDGRISMRYRTVGALPPGEGASVGIQNSLAEVQSLGCKADLPLADGLTIELRPQIAGQHWLSLETVDGDVAPNAEAGVPVTVRWVAARPFPPSFSGAIELRSNDPARPVARFSIRLRAGPAPNTVLLAQVLTR